MRRLKIIFKEEAVTVQAKAVSQTKYRNGRNYAKK